jgi:hypothetical protein
MSFSTKDASSKERKTGFSLLKDNEDHLKGIASKIVNRFS